MNPPLHKTEIEGYPCKRGKVRDVYDIGNNQLVIVTTDRISCFDFVLPSAIPDKGRVLTQISLFWFDFLGYDNHFLSSDLADLPKEFHDKTLEDRTMLVKKCEVIPFECIVRGNLTGSGWTEYQNGGMVAGIELPPGLQQNSQFPHAIFTPSTKAETGHDVNISFKEMQKECLWSEELLNQSIDVFEEAATYAWHKGIIIADTKFEWGLFTYQKGHMPMICLIDEVLTPDSSRFWPLSEYKLGESMPSFDKQFVRDYLLQSDWDRKSQPPALPEDVIGKTREKYFEAYYRLTGENL